MCSLAAAACPVYGTPCLSYGSSIVCHSGFHYLLPCSVNDPSSIKIKAESAFPAHYVQESHLFHFPIRLNLVGLQKYSFHFHADTGPKAGSCFSCRHRTSRSLICPCMFQVKLILSAGKARIADTPGYRVCAPHVQVPPLAPAVGLGLRVPCNAPCDSGHLASLTEHPGQLAAPTSAGSRF